MVWAGGVGKRKPDTSAPHKLINVFKSGLLSLSPLPPSLRKTLYSGYISCFRLEGLLSPQSHAHVGEKHFEIVGPTFSNTVGEFRKLFSSVWIALILGKLAEFFIYKLFFTNAGFLRYFWKLLQWRKSKNPATSCMQISINRTLLRMSPSWHSPFNFCGFETMIKINKVKTHTKLKTIKN